MNHRHPPLLPPLLPPPVPPPFPRLLLRWGVVAVISALAAAGIAACGSAGSGAGPGSGSGAGSGGKALAVAPAAGKSGSGGTASVPASTATVAPPPPPGNRPAVVTTSTTVAPRQTTTTTAGPTSGGGAVQSAAGPTPAAPGTYLYHQVGTLAGTPAQGTLVVAPVSAAGTQVWTRAVGGSMAPSTSVMLFNAAGSYLVSPGASVPGADASCSFSSPVAWPPWPTTPGQTVSGQAACTGPISTYRVTVRVTGTATVSLNGQTVTAAVVTNTFVLKGSYAGSPINVTLTETDYYTPTLRIPVVTRTQMSGSALGISISTERTDTLVSSTPS